VKRCVVLLILATVIGISGIAFGYPDTVCETIQIGNEIRDIALTPDGHFAYVASRNNSKVSVISTSNDNLIEQIDVGNGPHGLAVSPAGDFVYVVNTFAGTMTVIRTSDNTVVGNPIDIGPSSENPYDVAFTPNGDYAYVAVNVGKLLVVDTLTNMVTQTIPLYQSGAHRPIVSPDGNFVYVGNVESGTVSVIQTSDNSIAATIDCGGGPFDSAITPDGRYLYSTNIDGNDLFVIDTATKEVVQNVNLSYPSRSIVITPDGEYLYVGLNTVPKVLVVRTSDNTVIGEVALDPGDIPLYSAATPDGRAIYMSIHCCPVNN